MMSLAALFIIFAAIGGTGLMVGIFAYFLHRFRQLESGAGGEAGSRRLVEQVNLMREDLLTVQEEMSSLTERLDFTEKLLMSGDETDSAQGAE